VQSLPFFIIELVALLSQTTHWEVVGAGVGAGVGFLVGAGVSGSSDFGMHVA